MPGAEAGRNRGVRPHIQQGALWMLGVGEGWDPGFAGSPARCWVLPFAPVAALASRAFRAGCLWLA